MSKVLGVFLAMAMLFPVANAQAANVPKGGVGVHNGINTVTIKNRTGTHKFIITVKNNKVVSVTENRNGKTVRVNGNAKKRKGFVNYNYDCTADVYSDYYPYYYLYSFWWC